MRRYNVGMICQLTGYTERRLQVRAPYLGPVRLAELRRVLAEPGLALKEQSDKPGNVE